MILLIMQFLSVFLAGIIIGMIIMLIRVEYLHKRYTGKRIFDELKEHGYKEAK